MSQPEPRRAAGPAIWDLVIADQEPATSAWERLVIPDMRARDALGRERYGTPLQANNGRDALRDAYDEVLDSVVYLRQAMEEGRDVQAIYFAAIDLAYDIRLAIQERDGQ